MEVYIELVILDNFLITYLIGSLTEFIMKRKPSVIRLVIGSLIATIITVFYPFVPPNFPLIIVKSAVFIIISLIFYAKREKFVLSSLIFLGITFLFGGLILAVNYALHNDSVIMQIPICFIIIPIYLCYKIVKRVCVSRRKYFDISEKIYDFTIKIFNKTLCGRAFMDTGNRLYDSVTGLPVVIISARRLIEVLDDDKVSLLVSGRGEKLQTRARYMTIETVGGGVRKILLLDADEFSLYLASGQNILYTVKLGVSFSPLNDSVKYDALLHPSLAIK